MSSDLPVIDRDVACERCNYNLRTLTVVHRCPECGFPALRSVIRADAGGQGIGVDGWIAVAYRTKAIDILSGLLGMKSDAIVHVSNAVKSAIGWALGRQPRPDHVSAAEICDAVLKIAVSAHGGTEAACEVLRGWGITRSEDVGRIMSGLMEAGLIRPSDTDSPAHFKGLFTLEQWQAPE